MAAKTQKTRTKNQSRLTRELLETARDMRASGLMTKAAHDKITKRHIAGAAPTAPAETTSIPIQTGRLRKPSGMCMGRCSDFGVGQMTREEGRMTDDEAPTSPAFGRGRRR